MAEGADVGVDADLEEEDGDEQVTDRVELAPDALGLPGGCGTRAMPATKAPTMGASLAASASSAKARVKARARATSVPAEREMRSMSAKSGGATRRPTTPPATRNSTATPMMPATDRIDTDPSVTMRTTTVRTTRPMTSSATAAPRTMRASVVASASRSPNTRAVMPTLVAVSAAPTNNAVLPSSPMRLIAPMPSTIGATRRRRRRAGTSWPTLPSSRRSISMPTSSRSRITPISPRVRSTSSLPPTALSIDGPTRMPATISPTTGGTPMRSAISAAAFAAMSTIRMWRRISAMSMADRGQVAGVVGRAPGGHGRAAPAR